MREEISFLVYHRLRTYSAPGKKLVQVQVRQLGYLWKLRPCNCHSRRLNHTEKEPDEKEVGKVLADGAQGRDYAPGGDTDRQVKARPANVRQGHVGRDLWAGQRGEQSTVVKLDAPEGECNRRICRQEESAGLVKCSPMRYSQDRQAGLILWL